jgi:uncharacterized protein (TIGR04141 family)
MPRARQRDITFYLVKEPITDFDAILPPQDGVTHWDLREADLPYAGRLAVKTPSSNPPWWAGWLRPSFPDIGNLRNMSNQAALLLRAPSGRLFVVTFSYGRNLRAVDAFERDFGLRVALNVVDPDSLKSVDARSFEQLTVMTRSQTSRAASLDSFRMSRAEDIMKGVTGKPRDSSFATRITGADAAKILFVPDLHRIHEKCDVLLQAYRAEAYKERFGFIDNLRAVRDPVKITALNGEVASRLAAGTLGSMHMAPPEVTDIENIEHFVFEDEENDRLEELDLAAYSAFAIQSGLELTADAMRRSRIGVTYRGNEAVHFLWSAFDCLVAEIPDENELFVLSGGTWYQIEHDFVRQVAEAVGGRSRQPEFLPLRRSAETEPAYTQRAASSNRLHRLDGCLATPAGARTPMEFCDLLCPDRRLVHVKRRSRSSTLSHLFAQGLLSAEVFIRDATFRAEIVEKLTERGQRDAAALVPAARPRADEWEIVYAVLGERAPGQADDLPFFSQLNFKLTAERLEDLNYRVSLRQIPVDV